MPMGNNGDRSHYDKDKPPQTRIIPLAEHGRLGPVWKSVRGFAPIALRRMMGTPVAAENCPDIFLEPI
ncbi:MAG: hypothetical protein AAGA67_01765 [Cyanobacteria bacterium P01_F01_bin.153]